MSRNAIGHRDNDKVPRDSVVVLNILQTQYDNYDAPESRWRRQGTLATSQI